MDAHVHKLCRSAILARLVGPHGLASGASRKLGLASQRKEGIGNAAPDNMPHLRTLSINWRRESWIVVAWLG